MRKLKYQDVAKAITFAVLSLSSNEVSAHALDLEDDSPTLSQNINVFGRGYENIIDFQVYGLLEKSKPLKGGALCFPKITNEPDQDLQEALIKFGSMAINLNEIIKESHQDLQRLENRIRGVEEVIAQSSAGTAVQSHVSHEGHDDLLTFFADFWKAIRLK